LFPARPGPRVDASISTREGIREGPRAEEHGALSQRRAVATGRKEVGVAKLVFGMNLSLDGYVDHEAFAPDAELFRHWIEQVRGLTGSLYGRRIYEIMRYWDEDHPQWTAAEHAFAEAWRRQPKWVVSRTLAAVAPNAELISGDVEAAVRELKGRLEGEVDVAGPDLAQSLGEMGLIDEYRLYFHPVVLGGGRPFFRGALPSLRLVASDRIGRDVMRLTYVPA
jgi:dihydrofolate reductase